MTGFMMNHNITQHNQILIPNPEDTRNKITSKQKGIIIIMFQPVHCIIKDRQMFRYLFGLSTNIHYTLEVTYSDIFGSLPIYV